MIDVFSLCSIFQVQIGAKFPLSDSHYLTTTFACNLISFEAAPTIT